jgi:hypothetical protein
MIEINDPVEDGATGAVVAITGSFEGVVGAKLLVIMGSDSVFVVSAVSGSTVFTSGKKSSTELFVSEGISSGVGSKAGGVYAVDEDLFSEVGIVSVGVERVGSGETGRGVVGFGDKDGGLGKLPRSSFIVF